MTKDENKICRVCGYKYYNFFPWGESGQYSSFDICHCCGTTFGYQDFTIEAIKRQRKLWIEEMECKWRDPEYKPKGWSLEESLKNIPEKYR